MSLSKWSVTLTASLAVWLTALPARAAFMEILLSDFSGSEAVVEFGTAANLVASPYTEEGATFSATGYSITTPDFLYLESASVVSIVLPSGMNRFGYDFATPSPGGTIEFFSDAAKTVSLGSFVFLPTGSGFSGFESDDAFLSVEISGPSGKAEAYLDNIRFEASAVPEASSLVMGLCLAAGCMGVSWARRKKTPAAESL